MVTLSAPDGIAALRPALREIVATARDAAPDEAGDLLRMLDRDAASSLAGIASLAAGLARLRARVLAAPNGGREGWEGVFAAGEALRGPLLDAFRVAPLHERERLLMHLRGLGAAGRLPEPAVASRQAEEVLVAVAGDFKRGKSMLVNALLGRHLLPTRVAPATAIPASVRWGPEPAARLLFRDGRPARGIDPAEIERYACLPVPGEKDEVAYRDDIERLEIEAPWVAPGLALVDLPGLNEEAGRARMAWETLDRVDAVLVTLSATQLLAEDELTFIGTLWELGHRSLIFAVNYADRLEGDDAQAVRERAERLLAPYGGDWGRSMFLVSARQALEAHAAVERSDTEVFCQGPDAAGFAGSRGAADPSFAALMQALQRLVTDDREMVRQTSRLRQALGCLEAEEARRAEVALDLRVAVRRRSEELAAHARLLHSTERAQADALAEAEDAIAARLDALDAAERAHDDAWTEVERDLETKCREETLPWVWQEAGPWLRERLIGAIRSINPDVMPRPEGHLRIRVAPGLRVGRDGLYAFYRGEAAREWSRFTSDALAARRAQLQTEVDAACQARDGLAAAQADVWPQLAAAHASLRAESERVQQEAALALGAAVEAALAIATALEG